MYTFAPKPLAVHTSQPWELRQHESGTATITGLALGEQQHDGPALSVAGGVEFGVQAALGAADAAGKCAFWSRLAAVRCALRWVLSIISLPGGPPSAARAAKTLSKTPMRLQRRKRL